MVVGEHMSKNPVTVTPRDTLAKAQAELNAGEFRQLPVVADGKLVGIITDRDIRRHGKQLRITRVNEAMTAENLRTVTPSTPLEEAIRMLLKHKIGGLPVVEGDRLVGIITISDILRAFLDMIGTLAKGAREKGLM